MVDIKIQIRYKKFMLMENIKENLTEQSGTAQRNETSFNIKK
jgi:hypothetical protein